MLTSQRLRTHRKRRDGVAAVELAMMSPFFLFLILGILELGSGFDAGVKLTSAVREGGRLAAMDFTKLTSVGQTANQKVESDIRNYLSASGIPGAEATVSITHADGSNEGQTFDLEADNNYLELFRITVEIPYEAISVFPLTYLEGKDLSASIVFRKGRVKG